ncbi:hypothetical protein HELRODRAFT_174863 [Helobdella robusta]|uniref:Uncharacterized protein n=1 Tax=Helobdella robusta TaxID=6412 RepID=T1F8J9_HELRO|nr:hypothetical protein HELRODRAFT_174863 [Helobdella robusta]ESO01312.1 hypothetical protein HELRODRAFT_174863 [Helobdella robusta]
MDPVKTVKFVGKTLNFSGKRLFDILCRLQNFGIGRIVYRNSFYERYDEPCYIRITGVDPDMSDPTQSSLNKRSESVAYGTQVFRGENMGEIKIRNGAKADWRLVMKQDEEEFLRKANSVPKRVKTEPPKAVRFPPLLEQFLIQEANERGNVSEEGPLLQLKVRSHENNNINNNF